MLFAIVPLADAALQWQPRWAGTMKRLIKIGRHVFYRDS